MNNSNESMSVQDALETMYYQGLGYLKGIGVERDTDKAVNHITAVATAGLPIAMERLYFMYSYGDGVTANRNIAKYWQDKYNETIKE